MKTTITTRKKYAGHFEVNIFQDHKFLGTFETTDMQLIDDISELDDGFEHELSMFDTFEEVEEYCIEKLSKK